MLITQFCRVDKLLLQPQYFYVIYSGVTVRYVSASYTHACAYIAATVGYIIGDRREFE